MTAEELLALPDDGMRHELVEGVLTTMAPAGGRHGSVAGRIVRLLILFDPEAKLGEAWLGDTGFKLAADPDTVRAPDIAFVGRERLDEGPTVGFPAYAPDLAIEVLSPSNSADEMSRKVDEYLRAGARLVWLVDPDARSITVWSAAGAVPILHEDDELDGGDVLPGFRCRVRDVFGT